MRATVAACDTTTSVASAGFSSRKLLSQQAAGYKPSKPDDENEIPRSVVGGQAPARKIVYFLKKEDVTRERELAPRSHVEEAHKSRSNWQETPQKSAMTLVPLQSGQTFKVTDGKTQMVERRKSDVSQAKIVQSKHGEALYPVKIVSRYNENVGRPVSVNEVDKCRTPPIRRSTPTSDFVAQSRRSLVFAVREGAKQKMVHDKKAPAKKRQQSTSQPKPKKEKAATAPLSPPAKKPRERKRPEKMKPLNVEALHAPDPMRASASSRADPGFADLGGYFVEADRTTSFQQNVLQFQRQTRDAEEIEDFATNYAPNMTRHDLDDYNQRDARIRQQRRRIQKLNDENFTQPLFDMYLSELYTLKPLPEAKKNPNASNFERRPQPMEYGQGADRYPIDCGAGQNFPMVQATSSRASNVVPRSRSGPAQFVEQDYAVFGDEPRMSPTSSQMHMQVQMQSQVPMNCTSAPPNLVYTTSSSMVKMEQPRGEMRYESNYVGLASCSPIFGLPDADADVLTKSSYDSDSLSKSVSVGVDVSPLPTPSPLGDDHNVLQARCFPDESMAVTVVLEERLREHLRQASACISELQRIGGPNPASRICEDAFQAMDMNHRIFIDTLRGKKSEHKTLNALKSQCLLLLQAMDSKGADDGSQHVPRVDDY